MGTVQETVGDGELGPSPRGGGRGGSGRSARGGLARWAAGLGEGLVLGAAGGLLLLVVLAAAPSLLGSASYIVTGGSMEPTIGVGAVVVVEPVRPEALRVGDVITHVVRSGERVTHRVVAVAADVQGLAFRTQGDANRAPDPELVRAANVLGRVQYSVPLIGYLLHFAGQPAAKLAAAVLGLLVVLHLALPRPGQKARAASGELAAAGRERAAPREMVRAE